MKTDSRIPILAGITSLGISSVVTQITVTRELLNVFHGNELVIGYTVSVWLLLTGAGALLGRRHRTGIDQLIVLLVPVALLPFGHLLALRYGRELLALRGAAVDLRALFVMLPALLLPYCLISGYLLPAACNLLAASGSPREIGRVYFADTIGDILGGLLFSFVLVHLTTTLGALYAPALLCLSTTAWLCAAASRRRWWPLVAVGIAAVGAAAWARIDERSVRQLYAGLGVERVDETPYGRIVVTRQDEQVTFFENGIPVASNTDLLDAEETVHFALAQFPARSLKVLVISGALSGVIEEVMKYPVARLDYIELDPRIVALVREYVGGLDAPEVHVHTGDGRLFVERARRTYDAVLIDVPPPSTMQINRFYSAEFFAAAARVLRPGGVLSFSLPGAENYINRELARLYSVVTATVRTAFSHVAVFPATKAVFVAADRPLTYEVGGALGRSGIDTRYVNSYYLEGMLTPDRMERMEEARAMDAPVNHDLRPVAFLFQVRYWLSLLGGSVTWLPVVVVLAAAVLLVRYGPLETVLWTTGFVSITMELCIVLMYQVHAGSVYHHYGLIVALFMIGLAAGSFGTNRIVARGGVRHGELRRVLMILEAALLTYLVLFEGMARWTGLWRNSFVLYGCVLAAASIAGAQFPLAGALRRDTAGKAAGNLYAADFVGSGIGAFLAAVVLVPAMGIDNTVLVLAGLTGVALVKMAIR